MPLYEYQCKQCGHRFEKIQSFSAPEEKVCPECGGEVERLISAPAIQFKGAGWYVNDYAGRNKAPSSGGSDRLRKKADRKTAAVRTSPRRARRARPKVRVARAKWEERGGKSESGGKSDSGAASSSSGSSAASSSSSGSSTKSSS